MQLSKFHFSGSAIYWGVPTLTPADRAAERKFRRILRQRFWNTIGRVVNRCWFMSRRSPEVCERELAAILPANGVLRVIGLTAKQEEMSYIFWAGRDRPGAIRS